MINLFAIFAPEDGKQLLSRFYVAIFGSRRIMRIRTTTSCQMPCIISLAQLVTKCMCCVTIKQKFINKFNCNPHIRSCLVKQVLGLLHFWVLKFHSIIIRTLSRTVTKVLQNFHLARTQNNYYHLTSDQLQVCSLACCGTVRLLAAMQRSHVVPIS